MSAAWELQQAIYSQLNGNIAGDVYSLGNVPDSHLGQYAVVGDTTLVGHDADATLGFECTVKIDTWDNDETSNGFGKLKPLMGEIYDLLNRAAFAVVGYTLVDIYQEYEQPFLDPDGVTTHGVQRYRVILSTN